MKFNLHICITVDTEMKRAFDEYTVYEFSDRELVAELCNRLKEARRSCCFSQHDLSEASGVSIASIKRIEAGTAGDLTLGTVIGILRATGLLEGLARLVPELPESPFLNDTADGQRKQCRRAYRRIANGK